MRKISAVALIAGATIAGAGLFTAASAQTAPAGGELKLAQRGDDNGGGEHRWRGHRDGDDHRGMERKRGRDGDHHTRGRGRDGEGRHGMMKRDGDEHGKGRVHGRGHGRGGEDFADRMFDRLDSNDDGTISRTEAMAAEGRRGGNGAKRLDRLDTDNDGTVTSTEIDVWLQTMRTNLLDRMDVNKDGKIDEADRTAQREQRFARLDVDKDGSVSREEARQVMGEFRRHMREGMRERGREFWKGGAQ